MTADRETACARHAVSLGDVQETLLIPLYGRAVETRKKRPLLRDPKAVEMVEAIHYDFERFAGARCLFGAVLRTAMYDEWIRGFIADHPSATVVEIGTGLNTRFERLDNGAIRWFDLDLPDTIDLRRKFFEDSERRSMLAESILDSDWALRVKQGPPPYFFVAEAVLKYLAPDEVRNALGTIAREFPGSRVAFDTASEWMAACPDGEEREKLPASIRWACDDPREMEQWGIGMRLLESRTLGQPQTSLAPRVPWFLRTFGPRLFRKNYDCYRLNLFEVAGEPLT